MAYRPAADTLVACVWLPDFGVQVERWRHPEWRGEPLALVSSERQPVVTACSREARAVGVRKGMLLREVTATAPQVLLHPADEQCYQDTFARMADGLESISPLVEVDTPGRAFLDLQGLVAAGDRVESGALHLSGAYLYATPEALITALERSLPPEFCARFGIARGKFVAWAAARYQRDQPDLLLSRSRQTCWVADSRREAFLQPLPAHLLPVSSRMQSRLQRFGIRTLGQLAALPVAALLAQFGPEGRRAWLLARGQDEEPLRPREAPAEIAESLNFSTPEARLVGLLLGTRQVLEAALQRPERRGRGVRQARLEARLETGYTWSQNVTFRQPGTLPDPLFPPLRYSLERTPPSAAVETLTLALTAFTPYLSGQQAFFVEPQRERQARLAEELRQLRVRFGTTTVFRILEVDPCSRIPERRYHLGSYDP